MIPSFQDARKKKSTCIGSKTPGEPDTLFTGKLKGRGPPGFWEYLNSFQEPARAIQIPDSATRPGFWNLDRFQDPDIAVQNPNYAPLPAIWKLEDKIQIPNSEAAVSVYAPALSLHPGSGAVRRSILSSLSRACLQQLDVMHHVPRNSTFLARGSVPGETRHLT